MDDPVPAPLDALRAALQVIGAAAIIVVAADYARFRWGWSPVDEARRVLDELRGD